MNNFQLITINLINDYVLQNTLTKIKNLPIDGSLEVVIREKQKVRGQSQNAMMWAAIVKQISEQAFLQGKQFSTDAWHYHFKCLYLPENDNPDLAKLVTKPESYQKWEYLPDDTRILKGSTTQLTKFGFSEYMTQIEAYAVSELGVIFYTNGDRY